MIANTQAKNGTTVDHGQLNQLQATAICGNDILSSVLYVSSIATLFAGVFAPLVLLFVGLILFLYKAVYTEVVEALPINGGAYNCLLNGTSKTVAAIAGVLTALSYIATAVISAKVAIEYLSSLIEVPAIPATIALLAGFAVLVISGMRDSARVALVIFLLHLGTLTLVAVAGVAYILGGQAAALPENITQTQTLVQDQGGDLLPLLFLAFSASLLGISGFESSANFVEEQRRGVFRKTLRNMLVGVAIFNPLMAFLVLNILPYDTIITSRDFLLADAAEVIGGAPLKIMLVVDAFLVLSGAVLTSFVGVGGLIYRMAADGCLPGLLTKRNRRDAYPRIVISFFLLCSSILILTQGDLLALAGVYTISFLGVMSLFAIGNLILRQTRTELKRSYRAPAIFVLIASLATSLGVVGNVIIDPQNLVYFITYFLPTMLVVLVIVYQDHMMRALIDLTAPFPRLRTFLEQRFGDMVNGTFIVLIRNTNRLHRILSYINHNETGRNIILIHCLEHRHNPADNWDELQKTLPYLRKAGVFPHLNLQLVSRPEPFSPALIDAVSSEYNVRKNRILIGSIHHFHDFDYGDLGGVRIIL